MQLHKSHWIVGGCLVAVARALVREYHYARGASNTATYLHGMQHILDETVWGVAWWIPPTRSAAENTYPQDWKGVLALSRLVLVPEAPKNAASFLVAASMRKIDRKRWPCLVTYADEWQGHTGAIYKASNWTYVGRTTPQATWVLNGRMVSRKAGPKTRTKSEMEAMGARMVGAHAKHKFIHVVA
jgi:hypothetical protein